MTMMIRMVLMLDNTASDDDADDAEFHNASMIIMRMSMPMVGTLLLTVVY